jgi:hypothetical protein
MTACAVIVFCITCSILVSSCRCNTNEALGEKDPVGVDSGAECSRLVLAASKGELHKAEVLLEKGCDPNCDDDLLGTPLGWAAIRIDMDMVELFVKYGADICKHDEKGRRPLDYAPKKFREEVFKISGQTRCAD